ncbi:MULTISPECIES: DUF6771 family protein [Sphingomonas]|uniref:DUF6771 family protein n=1 Tax=Sphingomonas TaxID=13687 RepID=UPI000F7E7F09|nr:DUF6771 family protein [Sphingomonas sp. ABOLF]RSV16264.1 hypothetical protein CA235_05140 [Sphingomonas sp. ABOLF]GLK21476.1 hypothetical protein GCM10017606_23020 [Microbacterium terregens]
MTTPDSSSLAQTLLHAPGWARMGLTAPNQRLRERAAAELAETILDALARPQAAHDARQMPLPL